METLSSRTFDLDSSSFHAQDETARHTETHIANESRNVEQYTFAISSSEMLPTDTSPAQESVLLSSSKGAQQGIATMTEASALERLGIPLVVLLN